MFGSLPPDACPFLYLKIIIVNCDKLLSTEVCSNFISPVGLFAIFAGPIFNRTLFDLSSSNRDKQVKPGGY